MVAVDPHFMPLGTRLYIEGYGYAVAADTGGAIKGNRIDLAIDSQHDVKNVKDMKHVHVHILDCSANNGCSFATHILLHVGNLL